MRSCRPVHGSLSPLTATENDITAYRKQLVQASYQALTTALKLVSM